MKATIMLGVFSLLLAGCGSARMVPTVPAGCAATTSISVDHGPGRLVMMPECISVTEGASVTLTFSPTPQMRARTKFRGVGNRWLDRGNDGADPARIIVVVPPGASGGSRGGGVGRDYKYEIHVEGVGILDPRIVVER